MINIKVIKVYKPNLFLGIDLIIHEKVIKECNQMRSSSTLEEPCIEITPQMIVLYDSGHELIRLKVLNETNPNQFRCLFIDDGRIEDVSRDRMYIIPMRQLQIEPALKLYKIAGFEEHLLSAQRESNTWRESGTAFVCRTFKESSLVNICYKKECGKDKAIVEVIVNNRNWTENLKDLLIRKNYGFATTADDSTDSFINESVLKRLEEDDNISDTYSSIGCMEKSDGLSTKSSACDSREELSRQTLNNKIKSWLVTKSVVLNNKDETVIKFGFTCPIEPILCYQNDEMIASFLKDAMIHYETTSLLSIQAHMIPSILRGINVVAIAPVQKGKSMGMLMPVLQKMACTYVSQARSFNPLAIILCSSWKKVDALFDSAIKFMKFIKPSHRIRWPKVVPVYASQKERKIMIRILEGCDLLIITPKCLLRLLKTHEFFKLNELELMGLDDAENLIAHNLDILKEIFIYKQTGITESGNQVQQIVTATNWTSGLQSFVENEMGNMFMVAVNNPLEIAVFQRLQNTLVECDDTAMDLYQKLLTHLEIAESTKKRAIICASNDGQINAIFQFLIKKVSIELKVLIGSMTESELNLAKSEWNESSGCENIPVLLISDDVLHQRDISIYNAETIFHIDINLSMFGPRLNLLRDNFHELSFLQQPSTTIRDSSIYHSYVFLCPSNIHLAHANFLYKFLGRCHSHRPEWLQNKAVDYFLNYEKSKVVNEICPQIKIKGECQFPTCNKRHIVLSDVDKPLLPNRGQIRFRLLHLVSPAHFYVRILEHKVTNECHNYAYKSQYTSLKMKIIKYFSVTENGQVVNPDDIEPGLIAALRINDILERVAVTRKKSKKSTKVEVKLIDYGSTMFVESSDLLTLPKNLIDIATQAVEVFVVGIRPLDNDECYLEESCAFVKQFLDEKDLYGVVMLCIGTTVWLDSVTQLMHHKTTNISVYHKNLAVELIEQNFAEKNPRHIQKLVRLCTGKIDIWNVSQPLESQKLVPIMRKFTYTTEPLIFESLRTVQKIEDDIKNECTVLRIISPNVILLSNGTTHESIKQMQMEIKSLIDSIETITLNDLTIGSRILFCSDCDWMRGYVLKVADDSVLLFALDWGTIVTCQVSDNVMKRLPTEYQQLPYHLIVSSLHFCHPEHSFSEDVSTVIKLFVDSPDKNAVLEVSAYSMEEVDYQALFCDSSTKDLTAQDSAIGFSFKRFLVSIAKKSSKGDQEELFNVLVQKRCVVPSQSWIYIILPESQPFISRLERGGSIPHLGMDVLSTTESDKRLKLSKNIERIIIKNITLFVDNEFVPSNIDAILHTLIVLVHFVSEQVVFMCYYRALTALVRLAYSNKLPLHRIDSKEGFSTMYISAILHSYQSFMEHVLNHVNITLDTCTISDGKTFIEMFQLLLVNTDFVNDFFGEDSWVKTMTACVRVMHTDDTLYNELMDILIQLVMLSTNEKPFLADILKQCCHVVDTTESLCVWNYSLPLIGCFINSKVYHSQFRKMGFFTVLFNKAINDVNKTHCWAEIHDTSLELLMNMWRNGSVDRHKVVRERVLSDLITDIVTIAPGNKKLATFHADILIEESAITGGVSPQETGPIGKMVPDLDASRWMVTKDNGFLKKQKKSFRKIYDNRGSEESEEETSSVESDSDSDVEVRRSVYGRNPADEDNVLCYNPS